MIERIDQWRANRAGRPVIRLWVWLVSVGVAAGVIYLAAVL